MWKRMGVVGTILFGMFLAAPSVQSAESLKIGYVDAQKILDNTRAGKKSKESMEEFVKSRQKIIDLDESEIKQLQDDLARQAAVLSADARREKEDALQRKVIDYQKRAGDMNKEVQVKKKEVLERFNKDLEGIVKKVAERNGYTFIIDKNAEGGVLLYAKESLDLTDEVVKEFEKAFP
ncbi:MAG: OmpH family outer membrane protein [Nitrospirae bacterium]|nr:OmpH family outer membrane protein [Nitrospirota bacterium]